MNTSTCRIKKIDSTERNNYSTEQNIFKSFNHVIVPVENKQIVVPVGIKDEICNKSIRNILRPINENTNNVPLFKYTNFPLPKVFSPRKQNANIVKEKNRKNIIGNVQNPIEKFNASSMGPITTMEIFSNNTNQMNHRYNDIQYKNDKNIYSGFGTHLENNNRMNQLFLENNLYSKYTEEVDTNSTCSTYNDQKENLDYSMSFITKSKILGSNGKDIGFPEKMDPENKSIFHKKQISNSAIDLQNYRSNYNTFYSNNPPVINYNTINIIQHKNYNSTSNNNCRNGKNEVSKNCEDQLNAKESVPNHKIETSSDFMNLTDTNLKNLNSSIIVNQNQDLLKATHSISQKKANETEILLNNTMNISEMIEQSTKRQLDNMNNENPMNQSLKKGKKKTMGACFFNFPCLSCQFLMTCDKT